MKKLMMGSIVSMIILATGNGFANNATTLPYAGLASNVKFSVEEPFIVKENVAEFKGGDLALQKFIQRNISYPAIAKAQGIEGKVIVSVSIDETGNITNIEIVQGIGGGCEEAVVNALYSMPTWNPTVQAGHNVKTKKLFSFNFEL